MAALILMAVGGIVGVIICFNGYKMFRFCLAVLGGILGYVLGDLVCTLAQGSGQQISLLARIVITGVPAIGLAIASFALYMKVLIALTSLFCAYFAYKDCGALFPGEGAAKVLMPLVFGFIAGIILGAIVYFAQKWTICLFTAFLGARIIASATAPYIWGLLKDNQYALYFQDTLFGTRITETPALTACFIMVAFTAAGLAVQLKSSKKRK